MSVCPDRAAPPTLVPDMETTRNWALPVLLASAQVVWLWHGAAVTDSPAPGPAALVGILVAVAVETVALTRRRTAPVRVLVWTLGASVLGQAMAYDVRRSRSAGRPVFRRRAPFRRAHDARPWRRRRIVLADGGRTDRLPDSTRHPTDAPGSHIRHLRRPRTGTTPVAGQEAGSGPTAGRGGREPAAGRGSRTRQTRPRVARRQRTPSDVGRGHGGRGPQTRRPQA